VMGVGRHHHGDDDGWAAGGGVAWLSGRRLGDAARAFVIFSDGCV
jgi:hypothetical protein